MVGTNRQALTDVLHLLVPTTDLTNRYNEAVNCALVIESTSPAVARILEVTGLTEQYASPEWLEYR